MSEPSAPTRVAIVDDHAMVRQALAAVLSAADRLVVVEQGEDTGDAHRIAREATPDVLVLDYNLPGGGALPVLEELARSGSPVRVLILTVHDSPHYAIRVLKAGAKGFMVKSSAVEELIEAIEAVQRGETYISPQLSQDVLDGLRQPRRERSGIDGLSTREFEMLRILAAGRGLKQAAATLKISVSTASTYRARLLKKLDLSTTSELICFAIERGLAD